MVTKVGGGRAHGMDFTLTSLKWCLRRLETRTTSDQKVQTRHGTRDSKAVRGILSLV